MKTFAAESDPTHTGGRNTLGRFTTGCTPGPGRPRKPSTLHHVPEGELYLSVLDLEDATRAWRSIVKRIGPASASLLLKDLEAHHGGIRFRHAALSAIAQAQTSSKRPPPKRK